jgi:hypothetical protein
MGSLTSGGKGSTASCGVVLLRITSTSAAAAAVKIAEILQSRTDWAGFFSVADETRIRMVPLPVV